MWNLKATYEDDKRGPATPVTIVASHQSPIDNALYLVAVDQQGRFIHAQHTHFTSLNRRGDLDR